eukprot:CAMPEP_0115008482 /NCGR_PEP_ID=MMETSP0216-20121206/21957_1 /TAXON_ID=223996 /ORGANISM="Protocruzia adherens, Strain Boccale" /LENGTH=172 /DNA_ID=CAMNT_0002375935 /DNA_START=28 /DNA_END=543 /DNA_ORIENTATION=+
MAMNWSQSYRRDVQGSRNASKTEEIYLKESTERSTLKTFLHRGLTSSDITCGLASREKQIKPEDLVDYNFKVVDRYPKKGTLRRRWFQARKRSSDRKEFFKSFSGGQMADLEASPSPSGELLDTTADYLDTEESGTRSEFRKNVRSINPHGGIPSTVVSGSLGDEQFEAEFW